MRIFLSYASEDRPRIEPIRFALAEQGHDVFYDREDLKPGEAFDSKIRAAIERSDLFVCFLTPHTVDAGSYTLNELAVAERMWPLADGRVLPVILADVPRKDIPAYLRSVTCLTPVGNVTASVSDAVHTLAQIHNRRRQRKIALWAVAILIPVAAATYWLMQRAAVSSKDGAPLVRIEGGVFTMGDDEFFPMREVYVNPFYIDGVEITTERYAKFLAANGSVAPPDEWDTLDLAKQGQLPVVGVSWNDAQAYCEWAGKRLPTEAEWEFAARGGLTGKLYAWGDDFHHTGKAMANTYQGQFPVKDTGQDGFSGLAPVASFAPNGYGLYDVAGNAWEWISDWYRPDYYAELAARGIARNPQGPESSFDPAEPGEKKRVQRGGSFLCTDQYCSRYIVGTRGKGEISTGSNHLGVRFVKDSPK